MRLAHARAANQSLGADLAKSISPGPLGAFQRRSGQGWRPIHAPIRASETRGGLHISPNGPQRVVLARSGARPTLSRAGRDSVPTRAPQREILGMSIDL